MYYMLNANNHIMMDDNFNQHIRFVNIV